MRDFWLFSRFLLVAVILCLGFLILGALPFSKAAAFNNVQISIQTTSMQAEYFVVDAFNMTGYLEASAQTHYSEASFELPSGQYIFTVTANNQSYQVYPVPLLAPSSGAASTSDVSSLPIYVAPAVEYGFSVQQISTSTALTIVTQNVANFPTSSLAVRVLYANGTAAAGASVSVSVIGSSYYWGYESNVVTWATAGDDGVATLVTPVAPFQINAWIWVLTYADGVPVPQPGISGQAVNGTVIAVPSYVGLAGSAVLVPPQASVTITLETQQNNYWVTPYLGAATSSGGSSSGVAAGPGSVPYPVYTQQQGSPNLQSFQSPSSTGTPQPIVSSTGGSAGFVNTTLTIVLIAVIVIVVVVSLAFLARARKRRIGALIQPTKQ